MSIAAAPEKPRSRVMSFVIAGLALFAMYFGAGNLIFPVMIGVKAGDNVTPAILGFLVTGVLLPVLAVIAAVSSSHGPLAVTQRMGKGLGMVFTVAIFLSTGMLYAMPRVAAVSYEMAIAPVLGQQARETPWPLAVYTIIFFAIAASLVIVPSKVVDHVGKWLTPALIVLLIILVTTALIRLPRLHTAPSEHWAGSPFTTGIVEGYFTMDALASFVFAGVIVSTLAGQGFKKGRELSRGAMGSGIIAGVLLALVYVGLATMGTRAAGVDFNNGGQAIAMIAHRLFGQAGQWIFGLIALLTCLTTAIGLLSASTEFFHNLLGISRKALIAIHVVVCILIANLGLAAMLVVVSPINRLVYPIAIMLIITTLLDIALRGRRLNMAYRLSCWTAAIFALFDAVQQLLIAVVGKSTDGTITGSTLTGFPLALAKGIESLTGWIPMYAQGMAFLVPSLLMLAIGLALDLGRKGAVAAEEAARPVAAVVEN